MDPFAVTLRLGRLTGIESAKAVAVSAIGMDGRTVRKVEFTVERDLVTFHTRGDEFAYRISLARGR